MKKFFLIGWLALGMMSCHPSKDVSLKTVKEKAPEGKLRRLYEQVTDEEDNSILVFATMK